MTRDITGLSEVIDDFDAVLVDQYGVLHDGKTPFADARPCLDRLAERGMPVVALTNSGKRADANAARLARLGFDESLFTAVVSSGELARADIQQALLSGRMRGGDSVVLLTREGKISGPDHVLAGLDVRVVEPGSAAALVLISSVAPELFSRERYRALLSPLAQAGVPAICANPDTLVYAEGGIAFGPGSVAEDYVDEGGTVKSFGKPDPAMFRAGLARMGDPDPRRVLMIGDSPAHDIAGAASLGCRTLLISGGPQSTLESGVDADFRMRDLAW